MSEVEWAQFARRYGAQFEEKVPGAVCELHGVGTTDPDFDAGWLPEDELPAQDADEGDEAQTAGGKKTRGVRISVELPRAYPQQPPQVRVMSEHPIREHLQAEIDSFLAANAGKNVLRPLAKWIDRKIGQWRPPQLQEDDSETANGQDAGPNDPKDPDDVWTLAQQLMLEDALLEFPKSMEKHARWRAIASRVENKSKRQVINRFIALRSALRSARSKARAEFEAREAEAAEQRAQEAQALLWTEEQQTALDAALAEFPASMDKNERWKSIAKAVPGKTKRDCVDRFKKLRQDFINQQQQQQQQQQGAAANTTKASQGTTNVDAKDPRDDQHTESLPNLNPEERGTKLALQELFLSNIDVLFLTSIKCVVSCGACGQDLITRVSANQAHKAWCQGCSARIVLRLNPALVHPGDNNKAAFLDTEHAMLQDIASCDLRASCASCTKLHTFSDVQRSRPQEDSCHKCFAKLQISYQTWGLEIVLRGAAAAAAATGAKKGAKAPSGAAVKVSKAHQIAVQEQARLITPGKPLPNLGICSHYGKSLRWLRFPCCGLAYPCEICHDANGECAETKWPTQQICGFCGTEQPDSRNKPCTNCGKYINVTKASSHWEGGKGQRNKALMSHNDSRKYKNSKLKTKSNKANRVGPKSGPS
ncbi:DnaJ-like subfamily C member 2 [Hondaea fermentalgiana]|uniref:DnaJ-like subfamily C member 2 n=1 Tax=Hondaea fermentalgiana TaxID=2315210 RepID=A0A2R5GRA3_9STRA|nr:DnaJ-like subfamily C member 2 [Hondaea fermentalgiana]|eukprot:GBG33416.1 DnaJ-like subfamily C member 2 [Hondaea fermentalgiana]